VPVHGSGTQSAGKIIQDDFISICGILWAHKEKEMPSEEILSAQNRTDEVAGKLRQIEEAKFKVATERANAEERLQQLKEKLPRLLARRALEQATHGEILAIKRDLMELEELLADFPLTLQGLDALERSVRTGSVDDQLSVESGLTAASAAI
jgi:hypothetical protein